MPTENDAITSSTQFDRCEHMNADGITRCANASRYAREYDEHHITMLCACHAKMEDEIHGFDSGSDGSFVVSDGSTDGSDESMGSESMDDESGSTESRDATEDGSMEFEAAPIWAHDPEREVECSMLRHLANLEGMREMIHGLPEDNPERRVREILLGHRVKWLKEFFLAMEIECNTEQKLLYSLTDLQKAGVDISKLAALLPSDEELDSCGSSTSAFADMLFKSSYGRAYADWVARRKACVDP